jgi:hypothetical protein
MDAKIGDPLKIETTTPGRDDMSVLFTGQIAGIEPVYAADKPLARHDPRLLHLAHEAPGQEERDVPGHDRPADHRKVLGGCEFKGPDEKPVYKHVYQDNMSDLDFARLRASRIGCFIWSENGSIKVKKPELDKDSGSSSTSHGTGTRSTN